MKKYPLPRSVAVRRCLTKIAAQSNRMHVNGGQPISGLLTLTGKAERLKRGHPFRNKVDLLLRKRKNEI